MSWIEIRETVDGIGSRVEQNAEQEQAEEGSGFISRGTGGCESEREAAWMRARRVAGWKLESGLDIKH
jgi:hypothetical protein